MDRWTNGNFDSIALNAKRLSGTVSTRDRRIEWTPMIRIAVWLHTVAIVARNGWGTTVSRKWKIFSSLFNDTRVRTSRENLRIKRVLGGFNFGNGKYFQTWWKVYIYTHTYTRMLHSRKVERLDQFLKRLKKKRPWSAAGAALGASVHLIILGCNVKLTGERQTVRGGKYV